MSKADPILLKYYIDSNRYMPHMIYTDMYHYTPFNAFKSIISSNKYYLTLWASRYDCLNDKTEGKIAKNIFDEVLLEMYNDKVFSNKEYELLSKIEKAENVLYIDPEFKSPISPFLYIADTYICCFCNNDNSATMWKEYSKDDVNLGFFSETLKDSVAEFIKQTTARCRICPVVYEIETQKDYVRRFLRDIKEDMRDDNRDAIIKIVSDQLLKWSLIFKKSDFVDEDEIRVIVNIAKDQKTIAKHKRQGKRGEIPYIELKLHQSVLSTVNLKLENSEAKSEQLNKVESILKENGYPNSLLHIIMT